MGRPRKRPNASQSAQAPGLATTLQDIREKDHDGSCARIDVSMLDDTVLDLDPALTIDPGLAGSADISISDMSFLDFLDSDFMFNQPLDTDNLATDWTTNLHNSNVGPHLGETGGISTSLTTPSLSSQGASPSEQQRPAQPTPSSSLAPPEPIQSTTCSCLADLYLALDSIARLPNEVIPALCTARTAAHAAHNAIRCEVCCPPIHKAMKLTAAAFQNSMLIGALIPSIADAYHRIQELVDAEATRAIATHIQLTFNLSEYGGTWGELSGSNEADETKVMDPAAWRRRVRSLLKIDVYGVNTCNSDRTGRFQQIGLRDLVAEMDERSRERHAEIDALIDAGLSAPVGMNGLPASHSQGKEPHCRHVVQLAREAVDNLHIA
ncbi:hypothetical protein N0V82_007931 [Gnomoniopsis sp. IMI 355080]|nr:hypothetical protein N0V82_007931 [Gnomoniopsis sp. IMI 355080]